MAKTVSTEKVQIAVEINGEKAGSTLSQMQKNVKTLRLELSKLSPETEEFKRKLAELQAAQAPLKEIEQQIKGVNEAQADAGAATSQFGEALFGTGAVGQIAMQVLRGEMALTEGIALGLKAAFFEILLPLMAIGAAFEFLAGSKEAFEAQKKASNELKQNLKGTNAELERLRQQADDMENVSLFSDEEITQGQKVLALYADNAAQLEQLMPLVADYAQAKGKSMEEAAEVVGVALSQEAGELEDLGVTFEATATKAERIAAMQKVLGDRVGGAAKAAKESEGGWSGLSNRFNDIQEKVGKVVYQIGNALVPVFDFLLTAFEDAVAGIGLMVDAFQVARAGIVGITTAVTAMATDIKTIFATSFGNIADIIQGVFSFDFDKIKTGVSKLVSDVAGNAQKYYGMATSSAREHYKNITTEQGTAEENARGHLKTMNADQLAAQKEAAAKRAEEAKAAEQKLAELRAQSIKDELARKKAELDASIKAEIADLKGSAAQKAEQERLIRANAAAEYAAFEEDFRKKQAEENAKTAADAAKMEEQLQSLRLEARKAGFTESSEDLIQLAKWEIELEKNAKIAALQGTEAEIAEQKALLQTIYARKLADNWAKIEQEAAAKRKEAQKGALDRDLAALDRHNRLAKGLVDDQVNQEELTVEESNAVKLRLDEAYLLRKLQLLKDSGIAELTEIQSVEDEIQALKRASLAKQLQMQDEQARAELKLATDVAQKVSDTAFSIIAQGNDREMNAKTAALDAEYAAKLKAAEGDAFATNALNEEKAKKKEALDRQQFEETKRMNIAQALMNGALAVTSILAQYPKFDGGFAMTAALILAGLTTAGQIAVLENQKFEKGGMLEGASHSNGGIKMIDSASGRVVGEAEGGELILSRRFVRNNPNLAQQLLYQSKFRDGAPMFANGGILAAPSYVPLSSTTTTNATGISPEVIANAIAQGIAAGFAAAPPLSAEISYQKMERTAREVSNLKTNAAGA